MGRMVKRLSGLEIDEVSLVDRPANQHGLVAIAKNHQEEDMPQLFDANDNPVDEADLQVGDFVYDEDGAEYQVRDDDGDDDEAYEDEDELAEVGKGLIASGPLRAGGSRAGLTARGWVSRGSEALSNAGNKAQPALERAGRRARRWASDPNNQRGMAVGAAGAAGGAGAYEAGRRSGRRSSVGKSFLDEISKAFTDEDRDQVIAKALDGFSEVAKRNEELEDIVATLLDDTERSQFTSIAKGYGPLPVAEDELGAVLQRAAHLLPAEDVQLLDRVFSSSGEIAKALYSEEGVPGGYRSGVLEDVYGMAGEVIQKGAELGLTQEAAVTAVFDANPDAYEEYLSETAPAYGA